LVCLSAESRCFRAIRERERRGAVDERTGEPVVVTAQEVFEEKRRRREIAALKREMAGTSGTGLPAGKLASDPEWDDVVPIVWDEPEGALATIAYPADYAEGEFSFLFVSAVGGVVEGIVHSLLIVVFQPCPTSAPS
jgi:protein farnesyltransferase/geranylgeranyltransferase type-1 subunit alpha